MDIRTLRYFLAVAHEKNITKAAHELYISQPSLSKQMRNLEKELGKKLLIREKRGIVLTTDGILLRRRAEEIVGLLTKTEREVKSDNEIIAGNILVGGGPSATFNVLAAKFRKKYPSVHFDFYFDDADDIVERLDNGSLDFGILLMPVDSLKYNYLVLPERLHWGVLMNADSPFASLKTIPKKAISRIPLLIHQRLELQRELEIWYCGKISDLNIVGTYNIIHGDPTIFIKSGLGDVLILDALTNFKSEGEKGLAFRRLEPDLRAQYVLVWKRHPVFHRSASAFIEFVKKSLTND